MLKSKDFVIDVFKQEIDRKNKLVEQLLQKQEELESKLSKMEEILAYNEKNGTITPGMGGSEKKLANKEELLIKKEEDMWGEAATLSL